MTDSARSVSRMRRQDPQALGIRGLVHVTHVHAPSIVAAVGALLLVLTSPAWAADAYRVVTIIAKIVWLYFVTGARG